MSSSPTAGMGITLKKAGTELAEVTSLNPTLTIGEAETTKLTAAGRMETYVPTKTGAEIAMDLNFLPSSSAGDHETDILLDISDPADATSGPNTATYTIVWNDASSTTWSFTAFWKSLAPTGSRDGALTASGTLRVTGVIDWSV